MFPLISDSCILIGIRPAMAHGFRVQVKDFIDISWTRKLSNLAKDLPKTNVINIFVTFTSMEGQLTLTKDLKKAIKLNFNFVYRLIVHLSSFSDVFEKLSQQLV